VVRIWYWASTITAAQKVPHEQAVASVPRPGGFPARHRLRYSASLRPADFSRPDDPGHPEFRLLRKVKGKSVAESFATPLAFRKATQEVTEFHQFQNLSAELTALNEHICRLRPTGPDPAGWTEAERKRPLLFIKKSHGKSRRFSK
jgi:hypothetical protein